MENSDKVFTFKEMWEAIRNSKPVEFKKIPEKKNIEFFKNDTNPEFNAITIYKEFVQAEIAESITRPEHINNPRWFNDSLELDYGLNKRRRLWF